MKIKEGPLEGLIILEIDVFKDIRGHFYKTYQKKHYENIGLPNFVEDDSSFSTRDVLRGLHYQLPHPQGKLVWVTSGSVWDVAVDLRVKSKTFGQWFGIILNDINHKQFYIPPGFAHGFCALSETVHFQYKCTDYYSLGTEHGIIWNDPSINIFWPVKNPILSQKDKLHPSLKEIPHDKLFT